MAYGDASSLRPLGGLQQGVTLMLLQERQTGPNRRVADRRSMHQGLHFVRIPRSPQAALAGLRSAQSKGNMGGAGKPPPPPTRKCCRPSLLYSGPGHPPRQPRDPRRRIRPAPPPPRALKALGHTCFLCSTAAFISASLAGDVSACTCAASPTRQTGIRGAAPSKPGCF